MVTQRKTIRIRNKWERRGYISDLSKDKHFARAVIERQARTFHTVFAHGTSEHGG